jgi:subtilisin family serine protease
LATSLHYYARGRKRRIEIRGALDGRQMAGRDPTMAAPIEYPILPQAAGAQVVNLLCQQPTALLETLPAVGRAPAHASAVERVLEEPPSIQIVDRGRAAVIPTAAITVLGATSSELRWARREHGATVIREGSHGKVLLRAPDDGGDGVQAAAAVARALYERGHVDGAHPNFLRFVQRPGPGTGASTQWGLENPGSPGVAGADVAAHAAWTITQGNGVRVAVLDDGVDTSHPFLKHAVVAEADFVDGHATARPDGEDAHGTACAGILVSRGRKVSGLAPLASLVAARIAKNSVFDDFNTADAIDWCWDDARADVLSNSWCGGPPVDVISAAFGRARTRGRGGKGSVVVVAAGNAQSHIQFPGTLAGVVTVGASNEWDARKTRTSQDGEDFWGSNFGDSLTIMAPGVHILTTDISGTAGYTRRNTFDAFNGTSAATPFVAASAALVLAVRPDLREADVRQLLGATADPIGHTAKRWSKYTGHGRVNAFLAVRAARRA